MNSATATLIVLFACGLTLATIYTYERLVRDLRVEAELARDHADQCQALMTAMQEHPSGKRISPDLVVLPGGRNA